jgi:hypothetical protein
VRSGSSYNSSSDLRAHFGLGLEQSIHTIEVRWVGGGTERFSIDGIDRILTLTEGKGVTVSR